MTEPSVQYLLYYDYVPYIVERRGPYRAEHLAHAETWKKDGKLASGGAVGKPPTGALFVFLVEDPAELDAFVSSDPYVQNGLVTGHRVVPWTVAV
jgi:uncharacterized protein YciI